MQYQCNKCKYSSLCWDIIEMAGNLPKEESILDSMICSLIKEDEEYRNYWKNGIIAWQKRVKEN